MNRFNRIMAATALAALLPYAAAETPAELERNKQNVLAFYELGINQMKPQAAADKYIGATYLQHNPMVADGVEPFVKAFEGLKRKFPQSRGEIKRVIAEGDLVVLHVHRKNTPDDLGRAVIDIFRLDKNGKIVEHWDVSQPVPEKTASGRSMF